MKHTASAKWRNFSRNPNEYIISMKQSHSWEANNHLAREEIPIPPILQSLTAQQLSLSWTTWNQSKLLLCNINHKHTAAFWAVTLCSLASQYQCTRWTSIFTAERCMVKNWLGYKTVWRRWLNLTPKTEAHIPLECWYLPTRLPSVTTGNTKIWIIIPQNPLNLYNSQNSMEPHLSQEIQSRATQFLLKGFPTFYGI
jgi:hypothetical protein